jgi:hypothetical protein
VVVVVTLPPQKMQQSAHAVFSLVIPGQVTLGVPSATGLRTTPALEGGPRPQADAGSLLAKKAPQDDSFFRIDALVGIPAAALDPAEANVRTSWTCRRSTRTTFRARLLLCVLADNRSKPRVSRSF